MGHGKSDGVAKRGDENAAKMMTRVRRRVSVAIAGGEKESGGGNMVLVAFRQMRMGHGVERRAANPMGWMVSTETQQRRRNWTAKSGGRSR